MLDAGRGGVKGAALQSFRRQSPASCAWTLLRQAKVKEAGKNGEALLVNVSAPNEMGASKLLRLRIEAESFNLLTAATPFQSVVLPSLNTSHWLDKVSMEPSPGPTTWAQVVQGAGGRPTEVRFFVRLQALFEQMLEMAHSPPQLFECHWRFVQGLCPPAPEISLPVPINSTDVDGTGEELTPTQFVLPLLPHQRRSLSWMLRRERSSDLYVCEQRRDEPVGCSNTDLRVELRLDQAFDIRGGLLCDPVGSGKTATVLALIARSREGDSGPHRTETSCSPAQGVLIAATLVLCPANVHSHWLEEAQKFCAGALQILALRTVSELRRATPARLAAADLVVVPYELLADPEYRELETPLSVFTPRPPKEQDALTPRAADAAATPRYAAAMPPLPPNSARERCRKSTRSYGGGQALEAYRWRRVVLDELQELCAESFTRRLTQNRGMYEAIRRLPAESRWGLSGTPEAFLGSLGSASRCARLLRCELNAQSVLEFVEHFCRQARVSIPVEVHDHICRLEHTADEHAIYLHHIRDHRLPTELCWEYLGNPRAPHELLRTQLQLCSHFLTADEVCAPGAGLTASKVCRDILAVKNHEVAVAAAALQDRQAKLWKVAFRPAMLQNLAKALEDKRREISFPSTVEDPSDSRRKEAQRLLKTIDSHISVLVAQHFPAAFVEACHSATAMLEPAAPPARHTSRAATVGAGSGEVPPPALPKPAKALSGNVHQYAVCLRDQSEALRQAHLRLSEARSSLAFFVRAWEGLGGGAAGRDAVECPVCWSSGEGLEDGLLLRCGHVICGNCAAQLPQKCCPVCRMCFVSLENDAVRFSSLGPRTSAPQTPPVQNREQWGSKLRCVVEVIERIRVEDQGAKAVVFAQWESLRHQLANALAQASVGHELLKGNIFERTRALERFRTDPAIPLLLLSVEDSSSGTNLTVASHVFLLHPMLASSPEEAAALEAQAIGRVRRLGQKRPVHIWRFVTKGTVEEQLCKLMCLEEAGPVC
eukprot:gnl/TRDRNA2_/TRDRNA2_83307_c0_seq1.p1 gnl/TRDRNA2_/TRDRNA2_83307_c0~~gnl/TRDRNA2_/TRDRNA2_83307_c0_seq1.p1  ORF type:complete len:1006 (-),score=156.34 gnl/TRDRNA2_/TRDRNA2_83307_c0_seq1:30-3023(-)